MCDWDIEPLQDSNPDKTPVFRVVYCPGIGRYITKGQAAREAAEANGRYCDPLIQGFNRERIAIQRERNRRDKKKSPSS